METKQKWQKSCYCVLRSQQDWDLIRQPHTATATAQDVLLSFLMMMIIQAATLTGFAAVAVKVISSTVILFDGQKRPNFLSPRRKI